jgi:hypothetical protein
MRIVLREIQSGLYLQRPGEWTRNLQEARTFKHSAEAMDMARAQGLDGLEVLLAFDDPPGSQEVAFPLPLVAGRQSRLPTYLGRAAIKAQTG